MANSVISRVLRNQSQSTIRILTQQAKPSPFLLTQIPKLTEPKTADDHFNYSKPITSGFTHVYPTFSFGNFLNPNLTPVMYDDVIVDAEEEDSKTIRADSVKKKRKKKMNKHKLRKLRKRNSRSTKN